MQRVRLDGQVEIGRWAEAVIAIALTAAAALPGVLLGRIIDGGATALVGVAVAAAAGLTAGASRLAATRLAALAAVLGGVFATVVVAGGPGDAWDAAVHGWAALATSAVPTPSEPRLLVPVALVTWTAAIGGLAIWWSTRARALALLPAAVALALAVVAAGRHPWQPALCGAAFVAIAAIVLGTGRDRVGRSRPAAVVLFGAAAVLAAAVLGPALAFGRDADPFEPREHLTVPLVANAAETPLDLVATWLQRDEPLFTVRASEPLTTRLVALDDFDGVTWRVSGEWLPAGAGRQPDESPAVERRAVEAEVAVTEMTGPWLPSVGEHPRVDGVAAVVHPPSGSLAARSGSASGATYSLAGDVAEPDPAALQLRAAAFDAAARRATELPGTPPDLLVEMAHTATQGATTPFLKAFFLQRYLRGFELDPELRGGHSYGHVERALTVTGVGTSEQFAAGFAVLGRIVGLPTRVVVGFQPGTDQGDGSFAVASGDVVVWPEVAFDGIGWVPFDPTPSAVGGAGDNTMEVGGQSLELVNPPQAPVTTATPAPAPVDTADDAGSNWWRWVGAVGGVLVVAVLLAVGAVVVRKRRLTRARRSAGDARQRTLGAWHDVLDRLAEDDPAGLADATVEDVVGTRERTPLLWSLYRPVNRALYSHADLTDADAAAAWEARDRLVAHLRQRDPVTRRVRRACDPRPLRR